MKKCFLNWNKDTVEDYVIFNHLFELSDGKIDLKGSEEDLTDSTTLMRNKNKYSNTNTSANTKKAHHKKSTNSNRNRKRY